MANTALSFENDASRAELKALADRLDSNSFDYPVGSSWTIATSLCHIAFWDQRALFFLKRWKETEKIESVRLDSESIDSINMALNIIALQVPGPAAMKLALESAATVDAFVAELSEDWAERIRAAGFERYLRRSLHRWEHLQKINKVLDTRQKKS